MTDIVIPVKNLSKAKGRLANVLNPEERSDLVLAMLHDVLATLRSCDLRNIWLVASDDEVFDLGAGFGARAIRETISRGYNYAVSIGLQAVAGQHSVMVLPADLPLIEPQDVGRLMALQTLNHPIVRIVPDQHNYGTNGLFLSKPDLIAPAFGDNSFCAHKLAATQAGILATVIPLRNFAMDIDSADDLYALAKSGVHRQTTRFLNSIAFGQPAAKQKKLGVA